MSCHWSAIFLDKLRALDVITDVASDQENAGPMLDVTVNREVASKRHPALDDRQHPGRRLRPADRLHDVHLVEPVSRRDGESIPASSTGPTRSRASMSIPRADQQVPLSTLVHAVIKPAPNSHQSPEHVPIRHGLVQPEAGCRTGRRGLGDQKIPSGTPESPLRGHVVPGQRPGLPLLAIRYPAADRRGADRDLHHPRRALREPDPPDHDPVDLAFRRHRRVAPCCSLCTWTST